MMLVEPWPVGGYTSVAMSGAAVVAKYSPPLWGTVWVWQSDDAGNVGGPRTVMDIKDKLCAQSHGDRIGPDSLA